MTVQNLQLGPFDQPKQGGLRLARRERGRTEKGARDWHDLLYVSRSVRRGLRLCGRPDATGHKREGTFDDTER